MMNFLKNCLKGRKNCSCICNTMQKPNQSYQKHPLFIIKGLLVNKTKKQSEKKDWFQWQMQKQEIFKYENHKESNERIKINQKPLLKEETTQLRLMCSPLVCSRKKKDKNCSITTFILSQQLLLLQCAYHFGSHMFYASSPSSEE